MFPTTRLRRLRVTPALRSMVRETQLSPADFIYPLFTVHGRDVREPIRSMPGVYHLSIDQLAAEAKGIASLAIPSGVLFGLPAHKDAIWSGNLAPQSFVHQAVSSIRHC